MRKQEWKEIEGYEGLYQISDRGRVKSLNYGGSHVEGLLKPAINPDGYYYVSLSKKGEKPKYPYIHRLVAETFIRPLQEGEQVHHLNGNKLDCRKQNLVIITKFQHLSFHKSAQHTTKDPKTGKFIKENKE